MRKILLFVLMALVLAVPASAVSVYRYDGDITTVRGDAIGGARATVYEANTTTLVTLYSGYLSGLGTKSNPTSTDSYGRFFFYVELGNYDIVVSGVGITTYTIEDVNIGGILAVYDGVYNVLEYGAVAISGTDTTSFDAAFQAAVDSCIAAGSGTVKIPPAKFYTDSLLTVERADTGISPRITIDATGATILAHPDLGGPILTIGVAGSYSSNVTVKGGLWQYTSSAWADSNAACIEFTAISQPRLTDVEVSRGFAGVRLKSEGPRGVVYGEFNNVVIRESLNAIHLYATEDSSWVNENSFIGGRIHYSSGLPDASAGYAIRIELADPDSALHYMNNNSFVDMSVECAMDSAAIKPGMVYDEHGFWNSFVRLRDEGFEIPNVVLGDDTRQDYWFGGSAIAVSDVIDSADLKKMSVRAGQGMSIPGGSSSTAPITAHNTASGSYPSFMAKNANGATSVFEINGDGTFWMFPQTSEPDTTGRRGLLWVDNTYGALKFYDGAGWDILNSTPTHPEIVTFPMGSDIAGGIAYSTGYYSHEASDNDFNPAATHGSANGSYAAHLYVVAAAGATDCVITITGTSITDAGARVTSDTTQIYLDSASANVYYETVKKWIGQISIEKTAGTDRLMNFGWAKYWDNYNKSFTIIGGEGLWFANKTDATFDIIIRHHKATGWTYNNGAPATPPTAIFQLSTAHGAEKSTIAGEGGCWKVTGAEVLINGGNGEGVIMEVYTGTTNVLDYGYLQMAFTQ